MIGWVSPTKMSSTKGRSRRQDKQDGGRKAKKKAPRQQESDSESDSEGETWTCGTCRGNYGESEADNFLECAVCSSIYCSDCVNMSNNECTAVRESPNIQWFCDRCLPKYFPDPQGPIQIKTPETSNLDIKVGEISQKLQEQTDLLRNFDLGQIRKQMDEMEKQFNTTIENLGKEVPTKVQETLETSSTWSEIVKKSAERPPITIENFKQAMTEVSEKDKEMHMRDRGIVIYRIPEKHNLSQEQRRRDDLEFVNDLLKCLECEDLMNEVTHMERLGKFDEAKCREEKFRPIKLRFQLKDMRDRVLKSLGRLKNAPARIKRVSIRHDLNEQQRQEWYNKIKEAKEMTENSPTTYYRVRGQPGKYTISGVAKNGGATQEEGQTTS